MSISKRFHGLLLDLVVKIPVDFSFSFLFTFQPISEELHYNTAQCIYIYIYKYILYINIHSIYIIEYIFIYVEYIYLTGQTMK